MNRRKGFPDKQKMPQLVQQALAHLRPVPEPDQDSWELARQAYVDKARAVAGDIQRAASRTEDEGTGAGLRAFLLPLWERRPRSMLARLLILLSVVFGGTLGTVRATENSVPGSPLYPVKLQVEDLRTARVEDPMERVERALDGAERRLGEAEKLAERGVAIPHELGERYAEHLSSALQAMETLTGSARSEAQEEIAEELSEHLEKINGLESLVGENNEALTRMIEAIQQAAPQLGGYEIGYDDEDEEEVEFTGVVEEINEDGTYLIDGWVVIVDDNTEFDPHKGAIVMGATVEVEGWEQDDGTLLAEEIEVLETDNDYDDDDDDGYEGDEIEFSGVVEAVNDDGSYMIDSWTVHTDHKTEFDPHRDAVMLDVRVYVEAYRQPGGTLLATEIEVEEDDDYDYDYDEVEFTGMVEAVNDDGSYMIDGWIVHTDHNTEFDPHRDAVMLDVRVYVEVYRQPGGTLLATEIEAEEDDDYDDDDYAYEGDEIEFSGMVEAVSDDGSYVVDSWTVHTDHNTEFDPHKDAIVEGATVEVEAYRQEDGSLFAIEIELEDDYDDDDSGDGWDDDGDDDDDSDDDSDDDEDDD